MRALLAIARKELFSFFFAPLAYVVVTTFLVVSGFLFYLFVIALAQPGAYATTPMALFLGGTVFFWLVLIILVPLITMKLGADEFRTGTIETLMTAPVSDLDVVLGKYLGAMALYVAAWLPTGLYALILSRFSDMDVGPVLSGYLGVLLVGAFFVAVGLFTSFVSRHQLVAAIMAFGIFMLLFLFSLFNFFAGQGFWKGVLDYVDLWRIMQDYAKGVIDTRSLLYPISGAVLFLALAYQALQTRRWR